MECQDGKGRVHLNIDKLKMLRKQRGLSQDKLADICQNKRLRVSLSTIKRAECGQKVLYRTAAELAELYDIPIGQLFDESSRIKNTPNTPPISLLPLNTATSMLFIAIEFRHADGISQALSCATHITNRHDYLGNCLRLWLETNSTGSYHPIVPICLVFKRLLAHDTRVFIQALQDAGSNDWKDTHQALQNIAWGQVVIKDEVASTVL